MVGLQLMVRPVEGDAVVEMPTVPVNPFVGKTVVVKELEEPDTNWMLDGLVLRVKSAVVGAGVKNSDIAFALASFDVNVGRFQFTSIVFVSE